MAESYGICYHDLVMSRVPPSKKAQQARQAELAPLVVQGKTVKEMQDFLKAKHGATVSASTIKRDRDAIRRTKMGQSKKQVKSELQKAVDTYKQAMDFMLPKARQGGVGAVRTLIQARARMDKILGLEAPPEVNINLTKVSVEFEMPAHPDGTP